MRFYHQLLAGSMCLLFVCKGALADEQNINNHFSGFASIGLVSNGNPDLIFRRDLSQNRGSHDGKIEWRNDTLLGLQWQTQWSYQFETTAQLIIKDRFNNSLKESTEWAFARYRPIDGVDIRAGRLGTDIFMLSDYRQVSYALPWVRPPHDIYGLLSFYQFDGIDINKRFDLNDSTLNAKVFYAQIDRKYPITTGAGNNYRLLFEGAGASINWELSEWKLRYSYADVQAQNNNSSGLTDALSAISTAWPDASSVGENFLTRGKHFKYNQLGMAYDNNQWWLQSEATSLDSEAPVISSSRQFYISIGRRIEAFTLYATRGYAQTTRAPISITLPSGYPPEIAKKITGLAYTSEQALNRTRVNQSSLGIGVRWDFASKMALKIQTDKFTIDQYGDGLWIRANTHYLAQKQTANVISASLDILF